ncbi:MAG: hypothetical protein H6719_27470 [Sandaracinaceae bacterium]|nr:hypothetical protein [Sandaracinaceae bacterium]
MTRTIALALGLLALVAPAFASAQRLGLEPFSGPRNRQVRAAVRDALEARVDAVVDVDAGELGDVDGVVRGETSGRRATPRLALTLVDREGTTRATETVRIPSGRRASRAIASAVASLLESAGDLAPAPAVVEPEPSRREPTPRAEVVERDDPAPPPSTSSSSGSAARPYLHLLAGISLRNRDLTVSLSSGRLVHTVPLLPEVLAELRVLPLVGAGDPLLTGLQARVRFAYALFFESETPSSQVIGGAAWSLEGDLGWLVPLDDAGIVELGPRLGGGFGSYGLDDNAFVPTVEYGSFEARAATRLHAIDEELVIRAEAGYRLALGSGALAENFGSPIGHGLVVEGGLEGIFPLDENVALSWLAAVEWQHVWLSFEGTGAQELAAGGEERFIRGRFAIGIALR